VEDRYLKKQLWMKKVTSRPMAVRAVAQEELDNGGIAPRRGACTITKVVVMVWNRQASRINNPDPSYM
jgi:hypothetical protein